MNPWTDRALVNVEAQETPRDILTHLTPEQKLIVWLRWTMDLELTEIARMLGVPRPWVCRQMLFARRRIMRACPHLALALKGRRLPRQEGENNA